MKPPTDSDRRYWLRLFTDSDIVEIAYFVFGEEGDIKVCHEWRDHLFPIARNAE